MQHYGDVETGKGLNMKKTGLFFITVVLTAACASVPFQETPLVSYKSRDPETVTRQFLGGIPDSFQLLTTVVFEYNGRTFSGIGTLEINSKDRTFKLACLNPMGVKLFDISGDDRGVTSHYIIPAIATYGDIAPAVGTDIKRIYFSLAPLPGAPYWKTKYRFRFFQFYNAGYLEYVFAGHAGDLVEKTYFEDHVPIWCVSYYEYRDIAGKRYPQGIVFVNYQHGYRLTIRQKEMRF
jgi:hypothetical protein